MSIFQKNFKNKKVIITGHTGFKGTWLTFWLYILGARVTGISKDLPSKPSLFNILKLSNKIKDVRLDIRNLKKLQKTFKKIKPNFIFHLAAQPLVKKSYKNPIETFTSNILGTLNVLESVKQIKGKCTSIIITSDKSYKNLEIKRGYHENDILGGSDPYSASKASAELIIKSYIDSFYTSKKNNKFFAVARAGNVIGGGDWSDDRLIPDCVKAWSKKRVVVIRNPNSTRPWQHVFEALRGYLILSIKLNKNEKLHGEAFNFGPKNNQNKKVIDLVIEIKKNWKNINWTIKKSKNIYKESNLLKLNSNKSKKYLKWQPVLNFSKTIEMVSKWYVSFYNKKNNIISISKKQVLDYAKEVKN